MRVLVLRQSLHHGNLERLIVGTAALLRQRDVDVDILMLYNRNRAPLLGENPDALPPVHGIIADAEAQNVRALQVLDTSILSPAPLRAILHAAQTGQYDLIHTHDFKSNVLGLFAGRRTGIPVVATAHGYVRAIRRDELYRKLDLHALRSCRHVVCVSDALRQEVHAVGVRDDRLSVIYNGLAGPDVAARAQALPQTLRSDLKMAPDDALAMAVGRLSAEKGHRFLVEAVNIVAQTHRSIRLVIVGDGPLRSSLSRQAADMGLADRVSFLGFRSDVPALIAQCDFLVTPSISEAFGNVILEAMALGKPTIVTTAGGMPEVVQNGETGFVVPLADSQALASAMQQLMDSPDRAQRMGDLGRARVLSEFTVERMADGLAGVYARIAEAG